MSGSAIDLRDVRVTFGGHDVLRGIDITVPAGGVTAIIGASGCGKSTVLNLISGQLAPTSGVVETMGQRVSGLNRNVTYMTQRDTLLPWRSTLDNVAVPLELRGVGKAERRERAREALDLVGVTGFESHRPHELSGGMRSRASLARSLLSETDVFLMDEPFAAIDALRRVKLQQLLCDIAWNEKKTIVYVTHDLTEAVTIADQVIVLRDGVVATQEDIWFPRPRNVGELRMDPDAHAVEAKLWSVLELT